MSDEEKDVWTIYLSMEEEEDPSSKERQTPPLHHDIPHPPLPPSPPPPPASPFPPSCVHHPTLCVCVERMEESYLRASLEAQERHRCTT